MDELRTGYADTTFSNGYEFTQGSGYQLPEYPFTAPARANTPSSSSAPAWPG